MYAIYLATSFTIQIHKMSVNIPYMHPICKEPAAPKTWKETWLPRGMDRLTVHGFFEVKTLHGLQMDFHHCFVGIRLGILAYKFIF